MNKGFKWMALIAMLVGAVAVGQLWAGAAGANAAAGDDAAKDESSAGLEDVALAEQLADWGRANNHAAAVALAGRIMSGVQQQQMENAGKESEAGADVPATQPKAPQADTAESLVAEAHQMAGANAAAKAAVEAMGKLGVTAMGSTQGCVYHNDSVNARTTDVYRIPFRGGEQAAVYVSGDGDTDLDLYVYDSNGNLIGSDTDYSDECLVTWTPAWTGPFVIKIQNLGGVWNAYTLRTN